MLHAARVEHLRSGAVTISAVLWDFGGVFTTSPFEAFNRYEEEVGLPLDLIRTLNATNPHDNAWARLERSEIDVDGFAELFESEAAALGHGVDGRRVLACLSGDLRPAMVDALRMCIDGGLRVACITNNVLTGEGPSMATSPERAAAVDEVMAMFEVVVESSKVGVRKPDPRIYQMACAQLGVEPAACVYLDDLGVNCKAAAALGMAAIKVITPEQALVDLGDAVGFSLVGA
jgi:putative hydrolase of the HAD superfamily